MSRKSSLSLHGGDFQASIFYPYFDKGTRRISAAPFSLAAVLPEAQSNSNSTAGIGHKRTKSHGGSRSNSAPFILPIQPPPPASFTSEIKKENGEGKNGTLALRVGRKLSIFLPKHQDHVQGTSAIKSVQIGIQKEVQVVSEGTKKDARKENFEAKVSALDRSYTLPNGSRKRPQLRPIIIPKLAPTSTSFIVIQDPPPQHFTADKAAQPIRSSRVQDERLTPLQAEFSAIHGPPPILRPKSPRFFTPTAKTSSNSTPWSSRELKVNNRPVSTSQKDRNHTHDYSRGYRQTEKAAPYTPSFATLFGFLGIGRRDRKKKGRSGRKTSLRKKTSLRRRMVPRSPTMSNAMYYQTHSSRMTILSASTPSPHEEIFTFRPPHPLTSTPVPASTRTAYTNISHLRPETPILRPTSIFDPPLSRPASNVNLGHSYQYNQSESRKRDSNMQLKEAVTSRSRSSTLTSCIKQKPKRKESLPSFLPNISR